MIDILDYSINSFQCITASHGFTEDFPKLLEELLVVEVENPGVFH